MQRHQPILGPFPIGKIIEFRENGYKVQRVVVTDVLYPLTTFCPVFGCQYLMEAVPCKTDPKMLGIASGIFPADAWRSGSGYYELNVPRILTENEVKPYIERYNSLMAQSKK